MQRLRERLRTLKRKIKRIFPISNKKLARKLSSVFIKLATCYSVILLLELFFCFILESGYKEVYRVMLYQISIYAVIIFTLQLYASYNFALKLEKLEPKAKCEILKIQSYRMPLLLITLIMMILILILIFLPAVGVNPFASTFRYKITISIANISGFLAITAVSILTTSFPIEEQGIVSLSLIENFEKSVEDDSSRLRVWNMLFKNAINDTEHFVRESTEIPQVNFYEPFNTIGLAIMLGDEKESDSARKWISELIKIRDKKNVAEMQRARQIIEHLDSTESLFPHSQKIRNKFELQYKIEPIRLRKLSRRMTKLIDILIPIATFALAIITFYLSQTH